MAAVQRARNQRRTTDNRSRYYVQGNTARQLNVARGDRAKTTEEDQ